MSEQKDTPVTATELRFAAQRQTLDASYQSFLILTALAELWERMDAMQPARLVMADGETTLLDFLKNAAPEHAQMDEWTCGYEACKRRLYNIIAPQLAKRT